MNAQDLRKRLEQTDNKLNIFTNPETIEKYDMSIKDFLDLISDFLNDEEIFCVLNCSHILGLENWIRQSIIGLISDEKILLQIISNENIMNGADKYQIIDIINKMSDSVKQKIISNYDFIEKNKLDSYDLKSIISTLTEKSKIEILENKELTTNVLQLKKYEVASLLSEISDEDSKSRMLNIYSLPGYLKADIIFTFNNQRKVDILLKDDSLDRFDRIKILQSFNNEELVQFLTENKKFCEEKDIHPYEIVNQLEIEQQIEFAENIENIDMTTKEKREILATLKEDAKQSIDATNFPEEYISALKMQTAGDSENIVLDLEKDLEDYRGLDDLLRVNPEKFTEEQRAKFMKLCDICPDLLVESTFNNKSTFFSTAKEYKEAEEWITSVIDKINPEYSNAQKMAIIDNEIGKKISYSPDFETEVSNPYTCRALWKIISSGYGVCNGVARVEQYMLERVGIESELVSSGIHSFLKIKNIELPLKNGEIVKGNTILDPTWNLAMHRFGGRPNNFCINYEQARKNDIDFLGQDHKCHKNDEQLQDATLNLEIQDLRELFKSVGLADEDGQFPIKDLLEKSKQIDELYANQPEENIRKQFLLLSQKCPEFATCQNSSMFVLSNVLLNNNNLNFNKCVVNRVYSKTDKEKNPVLYTYINSNELGNKFYYADKEAGQFIELPQEEFIQQFECYEEDLKKSKGVRPWETREQVIEDIDLSNSSGKVEAEEEQER